jgi:DNA-binding transcriptional MocR family regulator
MEQALRQELGAAVKWTTPEGGFFLWATFPDGLDTGSLLDRAIRHGVVFVPGSAFYVEPRGQHHARLSFATPSIPGIRTGVQRLAAALREELAATVRPGRRAAG